MIQIRLGLGLARGYETSNMDLVRLPCGEMMRAIAMPVTVIQYLKYEHDTLCFLHPLKPRIYSFMS